MDIIDIAGQTRVFGAPADWSAEKFGECGALPIRDEPFADGNKMVSEWKPTEIELEHLKLGAPLQLGVVGTVHPVVSLGVGAVPPREREEPAARMSRIQALMADLERHPEDMTYAEGTKLFSQARQLILDLMGISAKPVGEQIAAALDARARTMAAAEAGGADAAAGDLADMLKFTRRWLPECFPAEDNGQIPFARALCDSLMDAAEAHLKREAAEREDARLDRLATDTRRNALDKD
jgi:hypothetical protein